jgi:hypothetical protein
VRGISLYDRFHNDAIQAHRANWSLHATTIARAKGAPPFSSDDCGRSTYSCSTRGARSARSASQVWWESRWMFHGKCSGSRPCDVFHGLRIIGDHRRSERLRRFDTKVTFLPLGRTTANAIAAITATANTSAEERHGGQGQGGLLVSTDGGIVFGGGRSGCGSSSTIAEPKADGESHDTDDDATNNETNKNSMIGAISDENPISKCKYRCKCTWYGFRKTHPDG